MTSFVAAGCSQIADAGSAYVAGRPGGLPQMAALGPSRAIATGQGAIRRGSSLVMTIGGIVCCSMWRHARRLPGRRRSRSQRYRSGDARQHLHMKDGPQVQMISAPETKAMMYADVMSVIRFVVPGLGTALLAPMLDATDAAVVGRFASVAELAALSPSMATCDMTWLMFMFLSAATAKKMALARGRQDYASARQTLADMCCLAVCCGLAISAFMLTSSHRVLGALVSPAALATIFAPAAAYIGIRALAFPVQMLQLVLSAACFSALQDTVTPLLATAAGGAVNLALDLILIAGCGLGTVGAATATVSGQIVAVTLLARALRCNRGFQAAGQSPKDDEAMASPPLLASPIVWWQSMRPERMLPLIRFAAPFMSFQVMQVVLMSFETRMGSAFGALSLAAHQITYSIWRPLISLGDPIMQAALSFVPAQLAAGGIAGRERARRFAQAILIVAIGLGVASGGLGLVLGWCLPPLFTANAAVAKEAVHLAVPMMASILALSVWHCNQGLMLATGRAKLLAMLYTWNVFYFVAASSAVLSFKLTLYHSWAVWASMHAIFSLIVSVVLRLPGGVFSHAHKPETFH